jgi:hypothetical protein
MGLALLAHASIPLKFWDEAFLTAVFLINRLPSKVTANQSPFEKLHGKTPDYTFLRTFGCAVWPNLRPFNSTKLQFHSKKCVFLGYSHMHKGFKCLDPAEGRVYISRDVVFDESIFLFSSLRPNAGARLRGEIALLPHSLLSPNASFGDAFLRDQYTSPPVSSNPLPSAVDHAGNTKKNWEQNGGVPQFFGHYFMPTHGDVPHTRHEGDLPAPRTDGSASDHVADLQPRASDATTTSIGIAPTVPDRSSVTEPNNDASASSAPPAQTDPRPSPRFVRRWIFCANSSQ